jgi:hypothetical protein
MNVSSVYNISERAVECSGAACELKSEFPLGRRDAQALQEKLAKKTAGAAGGDSKDAKK